MPAAPRRPVVMADVAAAAGVSPQTVSRVLNGSAGVTEAKRARVLAAVQTLGYRPNLAARALASYKSGALGVLVAAPTHFGMVDTLVEVETAARAAGRYLVLAMEREARADSVRSAYHYLEQHRVDSIVVLAHSPAAVPVLLEIVRSTPTVLVLSGPRDLGTISTVGFEQRLGGRLAAEHLIGCGYRDLVHVAGDLQWQDAVDRADGFLEASREHGVAARIIDGGAWDPPAGFAAGRRLLAEGLPRAVFAANDQVALGLLSALREARVRVPEDVAVMGFDGAPGTEWWSPSLSTVRQDFHALGSEAIGMVSALLNGGPFTDRRLTPEVVPRATTLGDDWPGARPPLP